MGTSRADLREFPTAVRQAIGVELRRVQLGEMPTDYKPMASVGAGCYEIRVHIGGAWRAIYVAKFKAAIYVLHVFQKKTPKTAKSDVDIAARRYRALEE